MRLLYACHASNVLFLPPMQSMPGSGIQLTGKLGDVIKESAQIALAFLRAHAFELGLTDDKDKDLLEKRAIHLHMPEGSIGKEGPSAGIAIMTAFVSLFSKQGISSELGEFDDHLCTILCLASDGTSYRSDDGRDDLGGTGPAGWRPEGEDPRGAPRRHQENSCSDRLQA